MKARIINTDKCIGCGKCVNDCINQYLELIINSMGKKVAAFKDRGRCLECGHCNAICPQEAIVGGRIEDISAQKNFLMSLMCEKRTVRKYTKDSVISNEILDAILLAGQSAPTDRNRKSARIILIKDSLSDVYNIALDYLVEEVKKSGTINPLYAPTMKLHENRKEILWNAEYLVVFVGLSQKLIDAVIAAERMQLMAAFLGVGTAYRGDMLKAINALAILRETLAIKDNEEALVSFAMGNTELKYLRAAVKLNREIIYK